MRYLNLFVCAVFCAFALAACDEAKEKTPAEKIAEMEESGELPKLDRSDSIAGPDENGNGIRDDIEAYIEKNYQDPKQKKALMRYAKAFQASLLIDKSDWAQVRNALTTESLALDCVQQTFRGEPNEYTRPTWRKISSMITNTKARAMASREMDMALDGWSWRVPNGDNCGK